MTQKALQVKVFGMVQGVGFRYYTLRRAQHYRLNGYVKNLPDRTVEAYAEGAEETLQHFLADLRRGPSGSQVDDLKVEWLAYSGKYSGFDITF